MTLSSLKVAVLAGGNSSEREISLQSGACVADALRQAQMEVQLTDIAPDRLDILDDNSIDIFFIAMHGQFGEDGQLQQILEDKHLCYTGCGPKASGLAFDKIRSKKIFNDFGIPTAKSIDITSQQDVSNINGKLKDFTGQYVVKPAREGSSVGVTITSDINEASQAAAQAYKQYGDCMIEEFIQGKEVTIGILCEQTLPIIEICSKTGFYDFHAKYVDEKTKFLFDTITDLPVRVKTEETALKCFEALGCRDFARVDFIISEQGTAYPLEVNTIPGFTSHSLLPLAARRVGLSMSELCLKIVRRAFNNHFSE